MTKTVKKTLDLGRGVKLTIERPFTAQDAVDEFKREIEAAGGKVTQVQDEMTVTGRIPDAVVQAAVGRLAESLGATAVDYSGIEARAMAHAFPFGFPSWAHIAPSMSEVAEALRAGRAAQQERKPKAKLVKDVAPHAMSTWEFRQEYLQRMYGAKVHLVGQHYRGKLDQEVLGWKRVGNMALLVAEPDNPVDMNAVMVLMWNDQTKHWHHVGYVRATEAALLRGKWTGDFKNAMVARLTSIPANPDGHRGGRNIELTLTGEVRTYPGYRL